MTQLNQDQQRRFQNVHGRFLMSVLLALVYCVGVVAIDRVVSLERFGLLITFGGFVVTGVLIGAMSGYRCPACGTTPRARVWSLGGGEVAYSSMVALFPRDCSCCGVQLNARLRD